MNNQSLQYLLLKYPSLKNFIIGCFIENKIDTLYDLIYSLVDEKSQICTTSNI